MAVDLGDVVSLNYTNTSTAGAPANGGTVQVTVTQPDTTVAGPFTVSPSGTGTYTYAYQTVQPGRHEVHWLSTGANPGAFADVIDVRPSAPLYIVSLADAKEQLNFTGATSDEEIRVYLEAATGVVERELGKVVVRRTFVEEHEASGGVVVLDRAPVVSIVSVTPVFTSSLTWSAGNLRVRPSGVMYARTGIALVGLLEVTYVAGMQVVSEDIGLGTRIIIQHMWETQRGSRGVPRPGGQDPGRGYLVPNQAKALLGTALPGIA